MKDTKLIRLIQTLSAVEMNRLDKFICSPYHNSHQETIQLFRLIHASYPEFEEADIDRHHIYHKIYPDKPYNDQQLCLLRNYLLKLTREFLLQERFNSEERMRQHWWLKFLDEKHLDNFIPKQLSVSEELSNKATVKDANHYHQNFLTQSQKLGFSLSASNRSIRTNFDTVADQLDAYYLAEKLKLSCARFNYEQLVAVEKPSSQLAETVALVTEQQRQEVPIIRIYYLIAQLLLAPTETTNFFQIREYLKQSPEVFPISDLKNMYGFLLNYGNRQYRAGNMEFLREVHDMYKEMLGHNLLFDDLALSSHHYKNLVTIGLRLKEFEWTSQFIHTYKDRLQPKQKEGVFNYNLAHLYFYQGEYSMALRHLLQVEFLDDFYRISHNLLLMRTYYECRETEGLFSLGETFRNYIRRNKSIATNRRKPYTNFIRFTKRIYKSRMAGYRGLEKLHQEIQTNTALVEKGWLLEKIEEIDRSRYKR